MEDNVAKKMNIFSMNDEPRTKDKDGDDGEVFIDNIAIKRVDNGWMICVIYEDESESLYVFDVGGKDDGDKDAVKHILESMGLENTVKIK